MLNINGINYVRQTDLEAANKEIRILKTILGQGFVADNSIPAEVIDHYDALLPPGVHAEHKPDPGTGASHLRWMLRELRKGYMTTDKAHRWLGFVQGCLICRGVTSVEAERNFTRPFFGKQTRAEDTKAEPCGECHIQPNETCDICGVTGAADVCPVCNREKAHNAADAAAGKCPKDWAPRDPLAEKDCSDHAFKELHNLFDVADLRWPPIKKAIWMAVTEFVINKGGYVNAYNLTTSIYEAVNEVTSVQQAKIDHKASNRTINLTLDAAALAAYRVCAETRHVKLGDAVLEAIDLLKPDDAAAASLPTEKQIIDSLAALLQKALPLADASFCRLKATEALELVSQYVVPGHLYELAKANLAKAEARADELYDEARNWKLKAEGAAPTPDLVRRFNTFVEYFDKVTTKPTPVELYYPVKKEGEGTGWNYVATGFGPSDIKAAAEALAGSITTADKPADNGFELYGWVVPRKKRWKGVAREPVLLDAVRHNEDLAVDQASIHGEGYFPVYRPVPKW